jgi:hypothetical protein
VRLEDARSAPTARRSDAGTPPCLGGFWCAVHSLCRRPLAGEAIEILFDAAALTALDPLAGGARDALATGRDDARPSVPDLLAFATAPHRRPSPPQLHEQPRLSPRYLVILFRCYPNPDCFSPVAVFRLSVVARVKFATLAQCHDAIRDHPGSPAIRQ